MPTSGPRRLAILASGQGSNFEALTRAAQRGELGGAVVALLCDVPDAPVLDRARRLDVPVVCPPCGRYRTRIEDETAWLRELAARRVDVVILAGFMRRLHTTLLEAFPERILNIHPSLLPAFPGLDAIRQAFEHGVQVTGCTVHIVDAGLDAGPIVAQEVVPIGADDSLASLEQRVHEAEHRLYPAAVRRFLLEPWWREGRRIVFADRAAGAARG